MAKERKICPVCVDAIDNKHVTVPVVRKFDNQGPSGENLLILTFSTFQHCSFGMPQWSIPVTYYYNIKIPKYTVGKSRALK
jgi:hypothetical protein